MVQLGVNRVTPLMLAAMSGHTETVQVLLDAGADGNAKDNGGGTALMYAAAEGHVDVEQVLREAIKVPREDR